MISSVRTLKKSSQYKICIDFNVNETDYDEQKCKNEILTKVNSYAMMKGTINGASKCLHYKYKKGIECTDETESLGDEVTNITHKS